MKIIAKTDNGFLIEATNAEVCDVLRATNGVSMSAHDIRVGDKIPAYDYTAAISQLKGLASNSYLNNAFEYFRRADRVMKELEEHIKKPTGME